MRCLIGPRRSANCRRMGAILPVVAMTLPVMLILASFMVNTSYMELSRTELRNASDAASRAARYVLLRTGRQEAAVAAAQQAGRRNQVAGAPLTIDESDVEFGVSRRTCANSKYCFSPSTKNPNSVRVSVRRQGSSSESFDVVLSVLGGPCALEPPQSGVASPAELDIALVLDRSGSMAFGDYEDSAARVAADLAPEIAEPGWAFGAPAPELSRWHSLVDAVGEFLETLEQSPQEEYVSLITYNDAAVADVRLTDDYDAISSGLQPYSEALEAGATNVHDGIDEAVEVVRDSNSGRCWAAKVMILVTDGRHNSGPDPILAAQNAYQNGVAVYTISYSNEAEQELLQELATLSGGKHFHAATSDDLQEAFAAIAQNLPTLLTE